MSLRLGVDVGGTFTKAVAFDTVAGDVVAQAISPTTHSHKQGVAAGVVDVVRRLTDELGSERVDLVTHSTTQAVNAMLEGDVVTVGIVAMAGGRDIGKTRDLAMNPRIALADGHKLNTVAEFVDVTNGLTFERARDVVVRLRDAGAGAIAAAVAFAPDDPTHEETVAAAAESLGMPVTMSIDLTGLYGLELRTITAVLNASIVPIALRTADVVEAGVSKCGVKSPVMVMRGDGGATDLSGFRAAPARTLYSGQAASVAGVLRTLRIDNAVILEVGGTSTNVAAIHNGQPALSYVRVASHSTAVRALDVRVIGVAGGSMLRSRRRGVYGVGPRSAHISSLPYASFLAPHELAGSEVELVSPRDGDPTDYLVLKLADGRRAALTMTCAANALGIVADTDYARADLASATAAFDVVGAWMKLPGSEVARRMVEAATQTVGDLVARVIKDHKLVNPSIIAVGGGAGGLGRAVSTGMGLQIQVPQHAEIISAVGDALSLIRAERERAMPDANPLEIDQLVQEVEAEVVAAGAAVSTVESRVEHIANRGAVRVTVTGAVGLSSGAVPGRPEMTENDIEGLATSLELALTEQVGSYWLATSTHGARNVLFDRYGDIVIDIHGDVIHLPNPDVESTLEQALKHNRRNAGPMVLEPHAWVVSGSRFMQLPSSNVKSMLDTVSLLARDTDTPATVLVGRE